QRPPQGACGGMIVSNGHASHWWLQSSFFCETMVSDVLPPLHQQQEPICSTRRSLRTTFPQRSWLIRRTVPIAAHDHFYQSVSSISRTIASTARCAKASSGHVLIVASSHLKRLNSWGS